MNPIQSAPKHFNFRNSLQGDQALDEKTGDLFCGGGGGALISPRPGIGIHSNYAEMYSPEQHHRFIRTKRHQDSSEDSNMKESDSDRTSSDQPSFKIEPGVLLANKLVASQTKIKDQLQIAAEIDLSCDGRENLGVVDSIKVLNNHGVFD